MSDMFGINAMDESMGYIRSRCLTSFSLERITFRNPISHRLTALSPEEITNDHALCNEVYFIFAGEMINIRATSQARPFKKEHSRVFGTNEIFKMA